MTRKSIRTKNIIAEATKAQSVPMPWARGARRAAMIARRSDTTKKSA
ncbi:hypothetical protein [Nereida sp. MMG025]|nr:hypothetical protein [Nereida sp. MMG025]MCF6444082.1 hypothetical protein [Nereida sp. MMG025]